MTINLSENERTFGFWDARDHVHFSKTVLSFCEANKDLLLLQSTCDSPFLFCVTHNDSAAANTASNVQRAFCVIETKMEDKMEEVSEWRRQR